MAQNTQNQAGRVAQKRITIGHKSRRKRSWKDNAYSNKERS